MNADSDRVNKFVRATDWFIVTPFIQPKVYHYGSFTLGMITVTENKNLVNINNKSTLHRIITL